MLNTTEQSTVIPIAPWLARDGFVAETAVRLDQLQAAIERLTTDGHWAHDSVEELREDVRQLRRERTFEETLRNAREAKIDEIIRCVRDLKERLSAIEGPRSSFMGLTYRSFESVDAKLKEQTALANRIAWLERWLVASGLLAALSAVTVLATALSYFV